MKLLSHLEKSKAFWYLLIICIAFFFLRLPSLIEPNWYGDEGIYQVLGQAVDQGRMLYVQIWDNKPPLLYLVYALFNGDQFLVRTASLLFGIASAVVLFYLAQKLFRQPRVSIIVTSVFTLLFATPLLEGNIANAENFMLLPIILAALLIYMANSSDKHFKNISSLTLNSKLLILFAAGLLLGIAFLFKIVAIFDFTAFLLFSLIASFPEKLSWHVFKKTFLSLISNMLCMILGFILPITVTLLYFAFHHAMRIYIQATFFGNIGYVGYANKLIIPQGFLVLKIFILSAFVIYLFLKRKRFSHETLFILLWVFFSVFNAFFSQRPYTHYVLVLLPGISLLLGVLFNTRNLRIKIGTTILFVIVGIIVVRGFNIHNISKSFWYYPNVILFLAGKKDVTSYQAFFDQKTPRDYAVASFILKHTTPSDNVFIWGDNPQIYSLSHKLPPGRYTVAYHIRQNEESLQETQLAINKAKPKYIVVLPESPVIPFHLPSYAGSMSLSGATIYEKVF